MNKKWYMLTLVGKDRPGLVAHVTSALYEGGCHLGETSMMRLGTSFTIMMMLQYDGNVNALQKMLQSDGGLHQHHLPDVRISIYGADRPGIVAHATSALTEAGLNTLDLNSDVGGTEEAPIYILHIEGCANEGVDALRSALDIVKQEGVETQLTPIDTMVG